mmetsp:Transcript_31546/g.52707  ORF Transcript_31546/g.52707 Transcript_31546/m.52707 type:complete len:693 (+) Transcript_31546:560-2638(+)
MYVRKDKQKPFLPSSGTVDIASAEDLFPQKKAAKSELHFDLSSLKGSLRDAETGEPIDISRARWNVKEGRLSLDTKTIILMGTGRLDLKNRIPQLPPISSVSPPRSSSTSVSSSAKSGVSRGNTTGTERRATARTGTCTASGCRSTHRTRESGNDTSTRKSTGERMGFSPDVSDPVATLYSTSTGKFGRSYGGSDAGGGDGHGYQTGEWSLPHSPLASEVAAVASLSSSSSASSSIGFSQHSRGGSGGGGGGKATSRTPSREQYHQHQLEQQHQQQHAEDCLYHTSKPVSQAAAAAGSRHPLITQYMLGGPLSPMHHKYWNAKAKGVLLPLEDAELMRDIPEEDVDYEGADAEYFECLGGGGGGGASSATASLDSLNSFDVDDGIDGDRATAVSRTFSSSKKGNQSSSPGEQGNEEDAEEEEGQLEEAERGFGDFQQASSSSSNRQPAGSSPSKTGNGQGQATVVPASSQGHSPPPHGSHPPASPASTTSAMSAATTTMTTGTESARAGRIGGSSRASGGGPGPSAGAAYYSSSSRSVASGRSGFTGFSASSSRDSSRHSGGSLLPANPNVEKFVNPRIAPNNRQNWRAVEEKLFQELYSLGWRFELNKSLTKEAKTRGGKAAVRKTARELARKKVSHMKDIVQAAADESAKEAKREVSDHVVPCVRTLYLAFVCVCVCVCCLWLCCNHPTY